MNILHKYGAQGQTLPIQSIEAFADSNLPLSIRQFALALLLMRTMIFTVCGLTMLTVSYNCKSRFTASLINITVFVIPLLIANISTAGV